VRVYGYITVATKEQGTFHFIITEKTGHLPRAGYVNLEGEGKTLMAVVIVGDLKYLETDIKFFRVKRGLWRLIRSRKFVERFKLVSVEIVVKR